MTGGSTRFEGLDVPLAAAVRDRPRRRNVCFKLGQELVEHIGSKRVVIAILEIYGTTLHVGELPRDDSYRTKDR